MRATRIFPFLTLVVIAPPLAAQTAPDEVAADYAPEIAAAARRDSLAIRDCLDRAPRGAFDRVRVVSLRMDAGGHVVDVVLDPPTTSSRTLRSCLAPIARTWRFTASPTHAPLVLRYAAPELRAALGQL